MGTFSDMGTDFASDHVQPVRHGREVPEQVHCAGGAGSDHFGAKQVTL